MAATIDLSKLSLKDALDLAVLVEDEACERYGELADQLTLHDTPGAAAFFAKMARIEAKHRQQLQEKRRALFADQPVAVNRGMIFDVEAPEYDAARAFMSVRASLEVALQAEVKAHGFFVQALTKVTDPQVRALFSELSEEELEHQALVRAEIAKLPPDDPVKGSQVDDPVAQ